ncbi:MAG: hypothetical protein HYV47_01040 [Candidatus Nealsonbacteria bacterium]|nr:hypothetical protein [Candidatus Nealsonbacteria bacterium]
MRKKPVKGCQEIYEGYGSVHLIKRLERAGWTPVPDGRTFEGMVLAGYLLNDTPDYLACAKYRVTVAAEGTEDKFVVEGYCCWNVLAGIEQGRSKTTFAGEELKDSPAAGTKLYAVTFEVIL